MARFHFIETKELRRINGKGTSRFTPPTCHRRAERVGRLVLLYKTLRFPIFRYYTFLYRPILEVLYFYLCFRSLRNLKILPHEFFTN